MKAIIKKVRAAIAKAYENKKEREYKKAIANAHPYQAPEHTLIIIPRKK